MNETEPTPIELEAARLFAAKREWHRRQAQAPLKEKVRILLKMQRDDYPLLRQRGALCSWERPWNIEP